jgi:hypothetical protein
MKAQSFAIQKIWPMLKFLQTDGQAKNYMPPIFRYGGIKTPENVVRKWKTISIKFTLCRFLKSSFSGK